MRYSKSHKEDTRRRLLDSSRALVKKGGFDATGVEALMASIGLTPGAFYSHFPSKQALLQEVVREEMQYSLSMLKSTTSGATPNLKHGARAYLSVPHVEHPEIGCVLPALGSELARIPDEVKSIIEEGLKEMHSVWRDALDDDRKAWAAIAQCVGAVILARSVASDATRREILRANREQVDTLLDAHTRPG